MKFNILIADDEIDFRDILVSIVEMTFKKYYPTSELKVNVASNGREEVMIASSQTQDIIITDINMPVMDGREAIKKIRLIDKSVPILALTALTDPKDVEEIIESGASNYTSKPLNQKLFIAQIKAFVNFAMHRHFVYNKSAINLITKEIYKRKTIFLVEKKDDIFEFWEYILEHIFEHVPMQDILREIYNLEIMLLKKGITNEITLEENENSYYFTLCELDKLDANEINDFFIKSHIDFDLIKNNFSSATFKINKNVKSVKSKDKTEDKEIKPTNDIQTTESEIQKAKLQDIRYTIHENVTPQQLLDELDPTIWDKLENFDEDLELLRMRLYDFEESTEEDLQENLNYIVESLNTFNTIVENIGLFNVINRSFTSLIHFLKSMQNSFINDIEKRILLVTFLRGLADDLDKWIIHLFLEQSATDIHYFDASFSENCLEIEKIFLEADEDEDDESELEFF